MEKQTILLVGGDLRQTYLANRFTEDYHVLALGLDKNAPLDARVKIVEPDINWKDAFKAVEVLILPMPAMDNDRLVNAPFFSGDLCAAKVLEAVPQTTTVYAGKITANLQTLLEARGLSYFDYLEREELAVLNAIPTAEGALQIILEELPVTVFGLHVLIVGAGRISRVLRHMLVSLGAAVTVSARRHSDLAWITTDGCEAVHSKKLESVIGDYDLIVNTVPAKILTEQVLRLVGKDALLLDLASKPGGIDFDVANQLGLQTIWALSLPGKVAPLSAGKIIYNTVCNMLEEWRTNNYE